jgi:hypothetical protein
MATQFNFVRVRGLALGALNGAIYSMVQFVLLRGYYDYLIKLDAEYMERRGLSPVQVTDMLNKRVVSIWFVLAFTFASYIGHRYWRNLEKSPLLLWEAIGITAIVGWNVVVISLLWIENQLMGHSLGYESAISVTNTLFGPLSIGVVIVTNFVYGGVIGFLDKSYKSCKR